MSNRIENAVIALTSAILAITATVLIIQTTSIKPLQRQIEKQNEVIIELAKIEKYRYTIENDFGKIKPKDSPVIISLDNKLDALTLVPVDTIPVSATKRISIFKRIFRR